MMEYEGYVGKVEFDSDAGLLHGEVVGIRDVVTFQGTSVEEVEKAFRESVDDYLDFCRQRGEHPDKPCSGKFVVRVGPDLHRRLNMVARLKGKSLNAVARELLEKEVAEELPASRSRERQHRPGRGKPARRKANAKVSR